MQHVHVASPKTEIDPVTIQINDLFTPKDQSKQAGRKEEEETSPKGLISLPRILAPPTKDAKQEVRKEGEKETLFPLKHHV